MIKPMLYIDETYSLNRKERRMLGIKKKVILRALEYKEPEPVEFLGFDDKNNKKEDELCNKKSG